MSKRRRSKFPRATCLCGCKRRFTKDRYNKIYATTACKNRVAQRNLRERARMYPERAAEQIGANGRQP